jgi:hypothetical protein
MHPNCNSHSVIPVTEDEASDEAGFTSSATSTLASIAQRDRMYEMPERNGGLRFRYDKEACGNVRQRKIAAFRIYLSYLAVRPPCRNGSEDLLANGLHFKKRVDGHLVRVR